MEIMGHISVNPGMFALWIMLKKQDICFLWPREHLTLGGGGGGGGRGEVGGRVSDAEGMRGGEGRRGVEWPAA